MSLFKHGVSEVDDVNPTFSYNQVFFFLVRGCHILQFFQVFEDFGKVVCNVLVEHSAWLELGGYDSVVWHVVFEACASDTQ